MKTLLYYFTISALFVYSNTVFAQNTTLGNYAGDYSSGDKNVFIGNMSGAQSTGSYNVIMGEASGYELVGSKSTILGPTNMFLQGDNGIVIGNGFTDNIITNQLFIGINGAPLIWGDFNTKSITLGRISSTSLSTKISTSYGYLEMGPKNTAHSHFYTDRPDFYFNKRLVVDEGIIASYNENLVFNTDISETRMTINNSTGNVGIGTTTPAYPLTVNGEINSMSVGTNSRARVGSSLNYGGYFAAIDKDGHENVLIRSYAISGVQAYFLAGSVGIGTTTPPSEFKLAVAGKILAEEIQVSASGTNPWPDFVFAPDYQLKTLKEVEYFINQNQHLPDVPSAKKIAEEGISLGEMNAILLQKIEELTLYVIELKKENETLKIDKQASKNLETRIQKLEEIINQLNK